MTQGFGISYVLERGIFGGTVAAAAISEGAPPSSWQKGDTPIPALGLGCVRRGSIPARKQHCLTASFSPPVCCKGSEELGTYLPAPCCSPVISLSGTWLLGAMLSCVPWKHARWLCSLLREDGDSWRHEWRCSSGF